MVDHTNPGALSFSGPCRRLEKYCTRDQTDLNHQDIGTPSTVVELTGLSPYRQKSLKVSSAILVNSYS